MHNGTAEQAQMIREAIEQGNGRHLLEPVLEAMAACGSLEWTRRRAEEEADKAIAALQILPDSPWREASLAWPISRSSAITNHLAFPLTTGKRQ
jgi:octaprenyl-diphosphate synthase